MKKPFYYNIEKLLKASKNDPILTFKMLENYYYKVVPKSRKALKYTANLSEGNNFLINTEKLLDSPVDINHKFQYLLLTSKRDILMYAEYGCTYLDLSYWPDLLVDRIKSNPLLNITQTKIHFLFED
jgi:hypothetical protein